MTNEITVTRAPRLKLAKWISLPSGTYFLNSQNQIKRREDGTSNSDVDSSARIMGHWWDNGSMCIVFDSFEAMCKWVANGRRLEDLQGDGRDEWIPITDMPDKSIAVVSHDPDDPAFIGVPVVRTDAFGQTKPIWIRMDTLVPYPAYELATKDGSKILVWPLKEGDSITITPKMP